MLHLIKYNIIVKVKNFDTTFWPLVFPLILATLFFFGFGKIDDADFQTVQTAVVKEDDADAMFLEFLQEMENSEEKLIQTEEMSQEDALRMLSEKEISGIYFVSDTPSLTVGGNGIAESILQSLLESYENGKHTMENVMKEHPENMPQAVAAMENYGEFVKEVSLGGKTINGNAQFFYALIGMTCLYGCFIGFGAALSLQANLTALAARRCVTPTHKLKLILSELTASFLLGYLDVIVLILYLRYVLKLEFQGQMGGMLVISFVGSMIGVSLGIFVGSFGKMKEGAKVGILLAVSMTSSFLAGLMNGNMKDVVEQKAPFINRINPAALISDAFYCINVYDDTQRYYRSLITLAIMCVVLIGVSFLLIRRERYDSL